MKKNALILSITLLIISSSYAFFHFTTKKVVVPRTVKIEYKGMNLVAPIKELRSTTLDELQAHHVNAVSLIPYAFVDIDNAAIRYNNKRQWWGEKTEGIMASNALAHEYNMTVMLKPHLWINHGFYTGNLDFATDAEWEKWETDYEKYILDFARLAQTEKMELFCFGTELGNSIAKRPQYWSQLIVKIKKIYTGKLTYAANWDDFDKVPFWNELDYIGIDAYFPLSDAVTPTVAELNKAWKEHIQKMDKLQAKINKKILFTEFGYRNSNAAAKEPWTENQNTMNNLAQANAYEALFQTLSQKTWFAGGFAWKWYADEYHKQKTNNVDYTPQGKPALETIKKWYKK